MRKALGWPPASLRVRNPLVGHLELQVLHCVDACPGPSCPQVNLLLSDAAFPQKEAPSVSSLFRANDYSTLNTIALLRGKSS